MSVSAIEEHLKQGHLDEALAATRAEAAKPDAGPQPRFMLFELLVAKECLTEAREQLARVIAAAGPLEAPILQMFQGVLDATERRHRFLSTGEGEVAFLTDPPSWGKPFVAALKLLPEPERSAAAQAIRDGWAAAPRVTMKVDGQVATGFRDVSDIPGPFLEVLGPGLYAWVPWGEVRKLEFKPLRGFQDLLWRPAQLTLAGGTDGEVWIPGLYAGSGAHDGPVALGRQTEFTVLQDDIRLAHGQRGFTVGDTIRGMQDITRIELVE